MKKDNIGRGMSSGKKGLGRGLSLYLTIQQPKNDTKASSLNQISISDLV